MPYIPNTPESLIQRSDSKDPAATCKGLTSTGRPCRRPLASSPRSSKSPSPTRPNVPLTGEDAYCWQHKDQAPSTTGQQAFPQGLQNSTIKERTSIDTLVDRLGLLRVESPTKAKVQRRRPNSASPAVHSADTHASLQHPEKPSPQPRPKPESQSLWDLLCCIGLADEEPPARPSLNSRPSKTTSSLPTRLSVQSTQSGGAKLSPSPGGRPEIGRNPSKTAEFLSLIPNDVSPETSAILLAELAKPISALDEPGFIYIYWLTPESLPNAPPARTASSLLAPPTDSSRPKVRDRGTSDVLQSFAISGPSSSTGKKPILIKIGRAVNVHKRMNEWQRQCGHNVTLLRWYPYVDVNSPSPSPSPSSSPKASRRPSMNQSNSSSPMPNVHKVERLIHLELTGRGKRAEVGGKCEKCGARHREWFQVEGSETGLREVHEVIKRWVGWAEGGGASA